MPTPDPADWPTWLLANPPPNLQELVAQHGTYGEIPTEAWAEFNAACTAWEAARRDHLLGSHSWALMEPRRAGKTRPTKRG